ncbi:uncharacterized protein ACIQIH_000359 isoform 2-T2 [Cyanocitta cristata]
MCDHPPRFYCFILVSHPLKSPWLFRNPLYWFLLVCTGFPRTEVSTVGAKPPVLVYTGVFPIGRSGLSFPSLWLHWRHREPLWPPVPSPWFSLRRYPAGAAALRVLPPARRRRRPAGCSLSSHPGPARRDGGGGARGGAGRPRRDRGGDGWGRGRRPLGRAPPSRPPRAGARRRRPSPRPSEPQRGPPGAAGAPPGPPRRAPAGGAAAPVPPRVRAALGGGPGQPPRLRRLDRAAGLRRAGEPAGSRAPGVRRLLPALPLLLRLLEEVRGHGAAPGQRPARRGGAGAGSPVHPAEHGFVDPLHLLPAVHAGPGPARDRPAHPRRVRGGRGGGRDGFPLGQALGIVRGVGAGARRPPRRHRHLRPPAVHAHPALQPPLGEEDLDQEKIRELVISMRQQIYAQNEAEVSKRWNFEDGIKRPYFHVKPLERAQLRNWREYLDFEVAAGSHERSIVLFERCLIACALYEEFWVKYTRYLESRTVPGARSVFQRACGFHLPRKPNIHLLWAAFEEKQGNVEEARRILRCFEAAVPGLAMVRLRRVCKVQKNLGKARKVLVEALEKDPDNARLHANLLEMEFGADVGQNEGNTMSCFERALRSPLPDEAKLVFSQRRVEFLEDFGSSIHSLLKAYDEHQKILKAHAARKRAPENGSEEPDDKRLRPDDPSGLLGPLNFSGADANPSYNYWYQHGYGTYGYQSPWGYSHYYGQS